MKKRTRQVLVIIATQAACLGVGLWMQYSYTVSTVTHSATKQSFTNLATAGDGILELLGASGLASIADGVLDAERLAHALDRADPSHGAVLVADANWRIRHFGTRRGELAVSRALEWKPTTTQPLVTTAWCQGGFALDEQEHLAVARALPGNSGYLLIAQDAGLIHATTAALVDDLPVIGALTMIWLLFLLSISVYMLWARLHEDLDEQRSKSASESHRQVQNLVRTRDAVIFGLAKLADSRDPETGEHLERISVYATLLATAAGRDPKFQGVITPPFIRLIGISSALHDIGKVGVADSILRKPGKLTAAEYKTMQEHAGIGGDCLREIEQRLGSSNFLQLAREIAYGHHENWDGSGYPRGLAGTNIPLAARIVAIADVYDALSCKRIYKDPFPHEECVRIIRAEAGTKFDPDLVRVWLTIESKFAAIARQLGSDLPAGDAPRTPAPPPSDAAVPKEAPMCAATSGSSVKLERL